MDNLSIDNDSLLPSLGEGWKLGQQGEQTIIEKEGVGERLEINSVAEMILAQCDGMRSVGQIISAMCRQFPDAADRIPQDIESVLGDLHQRGVLNFVPLQQQQVFSVPEATAAHSRPRRLCIGMATYDDYDGVYFSLQAIRLYHPEILDDLEFVVVDNHPDGPCAQSLKHLEAWIPDYRYIPCQHVRGTAVRDLIFREANARYVLCIDSHVMIEPGAIGRLLDYFEQNPGCRDLLQGPLLSDDLRNLSTHFKPDWREGMYGTWAYDERGAHPDGEAFDIPMQGLGLFACARDAWTGFNPRFAGFGGEEGYIHEKFRQAGGRTLCLPFLRWIHRFARPMGTRYEVSWKDRVRNYLIGRDELGLERDDLVSHFREHIGQLRADEIIASVEEEIASPFYAFDAIYTLPDADGRWRVPEEIFSSPGIQQRLRRLLPQEMPVSGPAAISRVLHEALDYGYRNILILDATGEYAFDLSQIEYAIAELPQSDEENAAWLEKETSLSAWYAANMGKSSSVARSGKA